MFSRVEIADVDEVVNQKNWKEVNQRKQEQEREHPIIKFNRYPTQRDFSIATLNALIVMPINAEASLQTLHANVDESITQVGEVYSLAMNMRPGTRYTFSPSLIRFGLQGLFE